MQLQSPVARFAARALSAALLTATLLAACGGDNEPSAEPPFGGQARSDGSGGDGSGTTPVAANLSLALTANGVTVTSVPNDGSSKVTATVTATDANGQALAGIPVTIKVDNNATYTASGSATDDKGVVKAEVGIGADRSNRTVTVKATSGGLERSATFQVVGAALSGTPLPAVIAPSTAGTVDFLLTDANSTPMSGQQIVVSRTDGSSVTGTTGTGGDYTYNYTAPSSEGTLNFSAQAGGASATVTVQVRSAGSGAIPPAALVVGSPSVSASPSVVPVNTGGSSNRSQIRALFVGGNNTAVKNVRVRFDLAGDTSGVGGTFSTGTNVVYSDDNGVATSSYIPGSRFSPTDGVTIRACWDYDDFAVGACPHAATTTLTVVSDTVSVAIAHDALIEVSGQTYQKTFTVIAVDSSGLAKAGVQISPSVDLLQYYKGFWKSGKPWTQTLNAVCDNEDLNRNSSLQVYPNGAVEDANGNGSLEPVKAVVAVSFVGSGTTDSSGQVKIKITYPQNAASWVKFNLQVAASGVAGTEGRTNFISVLPVPADAIADETKTPAFARSPYGIQTSPTVLTTNPLGQSGNLCTNPD